MKNLKILSPVNKADMAMLRQKAITMMEDKPSRSGLEMSEVRKLLLIHELQVHRIELELQNEELLFAKSAAQNAANKYIELYDSSPSGYFTLSKEGRIMKLNLTGANMLGRPRLNLKDRQFSFFVSNETKPIFTLFLQNVFNSKVRSTCELNILINVSLPVCLLLTGIVIDNSELCLINVVDVTEYKKEQACNTDKCSNI